MTGRNKSKEPKEDNKQTRDSDLDEGLEESFPASDPPAATQPGSGRRDKQDQAAWGHSPATRSKTGTRASLGRQNK
jgi:hypothetical protein